MHLPEHSFGRRSQTPPPLPLQALSESARAEIRKVRKAGFKATQEAIEAGDVIVSPVLANFLEEQLALDNPETKYNFLIKITDLMKEKIKSVFVRK